MDDASTPALLRALRVTLHVSFASLLLLGTLRTLVEAADDVVPTLALSLALAAIYLAATTWESRFARRQTTRDPRRWAMPWLALVTVLWGALALLSPAFSWVVFPLFFVYLVLLPRTAALLFLVALTAVVVLGQYLHAAPGGFAPAMVAGPALGMSFAVVVHQAYRALYRDAEHYRRTARALEAAQTALAHREREVGRASERERLSREIHDTLAQGLSSIVLMSRAAQQSLAEQNVTVTADRIAVIEATAAENLAEARNVVRALSSPALDAGLTTALRELCTDITDRANAAGRPLSCQFRCEAALPALPPQHQAVLLRAAQSLLANVSEHASARTAVLTLAGWPDAVSLDVFDDGRGFDPQPLQHLGNDQFGLATLQDRVRELHGSVTVESAPGNGTVVAVRLPVAVRLSVPADDGVGDRR